MDSRLKRHRSTGVPPDPGVLGASGLRLKDAPHVGAHRRRGEHRRVGSAVGVERPRVYAGLGATRAAGEEGLFGD